MSVKKEPNGTVRSRLTLAAKTEVHDNRLCKTPCPPLPSRNRADSAPKSIFCKEFSQCFPGSTRTQDTWGKSQKLLNRKGF